MTDKTIKRCEAVVLAVRKGAILERELKAAKLSSSTFYEWRKSLKAIRPKGVK